MRKKYLLFILIFIGILTIPGVANAELSCDAYYSIAKSGCTVLNLNGESYGMNTYDAGGLKTYCLDPTKTSGLKKGGQSISAKCFQMAWILLLLG